MSAAQDDVAHDGAPITADPASDSIVERLDERGETMSPNSELLEELRLEIARLTQELEAGKQQLEAMQGQKNHYKGVAKTAQLQIRQMEANTLADRIDVENVLAKHAECAEMISRLQAQCQQALESRDEAAAKYAAERLTNANEKLAGFDVVMALKEANINLTSRLNASEERAQRLEEQVRWLQDTVTAVQANSVTGTSPSLPHPQAFTGRPLPVQTPGVPAQAVRERTEVLSSVIGSNDTMIGLRFSQPHHVFGSNDSAAGLFTQPHLTQNKRSLQALLGADDGRRDEEEGDLLREDAQLGSGLYSTYSSHTSDGVHASKVRKSAGFMTRDAEGNQRVVALHELKADDAKAVADQFMAVSTEQAKRRSKVHGASTLEAMKELPLILMKIGRDEVENFAAWIAFVVALRNTFRSENLGGLSVLYTIFCKGSSVGLERSCNPLLLTAADVKQAEFHQRVM